MTQAITMPEAEAAHLQACYSEARVILEYGSGGSTELSATLPGKLVMSVENDRDWARALRQKIAGSAPQSQVIIQHVDIGQTGSWGRAINSESWQRFHRYPNAVWDAAFFRHPDVILIDGRFRTACLMTALLRIRKPVTILFDDYADRPKYRLVEKIITPSRMIGRMAEFRPEPGRVKDADMGFVISQFFEATFSGKDRKRYELAPQEKAML